MTDYANIINLPVAGSPRFEQDTVMALARIRAALGPEGIPTFGSLTLQNLTTDKPVYADTDKTLQSVTVGTSLSFSAPTLNTIQGIRTADSPTFAGLTLTGLSGVLKATAGVVSGSAAHADLASVTANQHHNQVHAIDGADHTASGLTAGHVLTATGATTFAFQEAVTWIKKVADEAARLALDADFGDLVYQEDNGALYMFTIQ